MLYQVSNQDTKISASRRKYVIFNVLVLCIRVGCLAGDRSLRCSEIEERKAKRNNSKEGDFVSLGWIEEATVDVGGKLEIICSHIGYRHGDPLYSPHVELHWFKQDSEIKPDDRITISGCNKSPFIRGTRLTIKKVRSEDTGPYYCKLWPRGAFPGTKPVFKETINVTIRDLRRRIPNFRKNATEVNLIPFLPTLILPLCIIAICLCACKIGNAKQKVVSCMTNLRKKLIAIKRRKAVDGYVAPVTFQTNENRSLVDSRDERTVEELEKISRAFTSRFSFLRYQDIQDLNKLEIQRERLQCDMQHAMPIVLGTGNFGQVYAGRILNWNGTITPVAVKKLNDGYCPEDLGNFLREVVTLMRAGNHINVISLVATIVLDTVDDANLDASELEVQKPPILLMELADGGNLRKYLQDNRGNFSHCNTNYSNWNLPTEKKSDLTMQMLLSFAYQVAQGMEHLSMKKILHRDLAARNVLLTNKLVVKIADFGLSKFMSTGKEYYTVTNHGITPAKWTAPESLWTSKFSEKSDVWSYGVLLWEILTLGSQPYVTIPACKLYGYLAEGNRLQRPNLATFELHEVMLVCWAWEPELRPDFCTLVKKMGEILMEQSKRNVVPCDYRRSLFTDSERDSGMSFCTSSMSDSFEINYSSTSFESTPSMETVIATVSSRPDDQGTSAVYEIMNPLYEPRSETEKERTARVSNPTEYAPSPDIHWTEG